MNTKEIIKKVESLRQGFADALDLMLPFVDTYKLSKDVMFSTVEAYHFQADKLIVSLGGETVNRNYKYLTKDTTDTTKN